MYSLQSIGGVALEFWWYTDWGAVSGDLLHTLHCMGYFVCHEFHYN